MRKPAFCLCKNKDADQLRGNRKADQRLCFRYAPVICIHGPHGAGDTGDIAGLKFRNLTSDESRQCRGCAGVLTSR